MNNLLDKVASSIFKSKGDVKIKWLPKASKSIAQIYSGGVEFALVSKEWEQVHDFVYCKDFLQDVTMGCINKKPITIFGIRYDPAKHPQVYTERMRLAVRDRKDSSFTKKCQGALEVVNYYSKLLKGNANSETSKSIAKSRLYMASSNCVVFEGSGVWMNSPPLISLYALLIRIGLTHTPGSDVATTIKGVIKGTHKCSLSDVQQLKSATNGIDKLVTKGYRKFFFIDPAKNFPSKSEGLMHSSGIVGFSLESTKRLVSYWHRKSLNEETANVQQEAGPDLRK